MIKERLSKIKEEHGASQIGMLLSENASTEEYWMSKKWISSMGSLNIDHRIKESLHQDKIFRTSPGLGFKLDELFFS